MPHSDLERKRARDRQYRRDRRQRERRVRESLEDELAKIWPQCRARRGFSKLDNDDPTPRQVGPIEQIALFTTVTLNVARDHIDRVLRDPATPYDKELVFWARQIHATAPRATQRICRPMVFTFQPVREDGSGGDIVLQECPPPRALCPATKVHTCPTSAAERERCSFRYRGSVGRDVLLFAVPGLHVPKQQVKRRDLADIPLCAWRDALAEWQGLDIEKHRRGDPIDERSRLSCRVLIRLLAAGGLVEPDIDADAFRGRLQRARELLGVTMGDISRRTNRA